SLHIEEYVARCKLGATLTVTINTFAKELEGNRGSIEYQPEFPDPSCEQLFSSFPSPSANESGSMLGSLKFFVSRLHQKVQLCIKFLVLSLTADPEYQRELNYVIRGKIPFLRWPVTFFLNGFWSFCKMLQ